MTKPMTKILDGEGNETLREMNDAEFAQYEIDRAEAIARQEALETKAAARQAVLNRLGITAEEAQLILGGSN
jgi:hypothetical protein